MLKNILNLKGAQKLSKAEQTTINGGGSSRCAYNSCAGQANGTCCINNYGVKMNCEKGCFELRELLIVHQSPRLLQ